MPEVLRPIAFLLGIWRSEAGGKAIFPTIPIFTYGEHVEISLPDNGMRALKALNYTGHYRGQIYKIRAVRCWSNKLQSRLARSRALTRLPKLQMIREWRLLDSRTFEARLFMETLTHRMQMHTSIIYKKIYPL
uniref:THAP4-like heme-binding beta-barrel domain-containing protein n=1 Tax=Parascaris equorum TaxID=6256 RepID=A0A914RSG2_PAREQ